MWNRVLVFQLLDTASFYWVWILIFSSKTTSYWFFIHRLGIIFLVVYLLVTFLCFCLSGYAISLKWCVYCFTCLENKKEAQLCKTASLQLQLNEAQDTTAFCLNDELVDLNVYGAVLLLLPQWLESLDANDVVSHSRIFPCFS